MHPAILSVSLYSSVAEHWSCKPGVESSILSGGSELIIKLVKQISINFLTYLSTSRKKRSIVWAGRGGGSYLKGWHNNVSGQLWKQLLTRGSLAEWSKALVLGTSLKGRGFESHHCQGVLKKFLGPLKSKRPWRHRGLNPGPLTCEASALPLSYIPTKYLLYLTNLTICKVGRVV